MRTLLQAYRSLLLQLLGEAARRGELAAGVDTEAAATLFVGTVQGLVMQSLMAGYGKLLRADAPGVFAIYRRGLEKT